MQIYHQSQLSRTCFPWYKVGGLFVFIYLELSLSLHWVRLSSRKEEKMLRLLLTKVEIDHNSPCFPDSIMDTREFEWESQLRFYWDQLPDELMVRQCTGEFGYGYEYMGLNGRLVITPLTDRIYLTISQVRCLRV